jgi:hypothetical protein
MPLAKLALEISDALQRLTIRLDNYLVRQTHNDPMNATPDNTDALAKAEHRAEQYRTSYLCEVARTAIAWRQAHLWEGKFHALRLENNALRKAARKARPPSPPHTPPAH